MSVTATDPIAKLALPSTAPLHSAWKTGVLVPFLKALHPGEVHEASKATLKAVSVTDYTAALSLIFPSNSSPLEDSKDDTDDS